MGSPVAGFNGPAEFSFGSMVSSGPVTPQSLMGQVNGGGVGMANAAAAAAMGVGLGIALSPVPNSTNAVPAVSFPISFDMLSRLKLFCFFRPIARHTCPNFQAMVL